MSNNGLFKVYGENCEFYWTVMGSRMEIEVEPNKKENKLRGFGPYTFIEK